MTAYSETKILIVIPTFNNRPTLRHVVEESMATGLPVLVADDGSTDGAMDTLAGLAVSQVHLPANRGKGAAIQAAAGWAEEKGFTHIITLDADGQHDPGDAVKFVAKIREKPWCIVAGKRDFEAVAVPFSSRFGRHFSNFWFWVSTGLSLPDSQSGYRSYPVEALRRVACAGTHYEYEVEILVRGVWAGLETDWVDVGVRYTRQTRQDSHFRPFWDNLLISKAYTRLVTRNFVPWPHRTVFNRKAGAGQSLSIRNPLQTLKYLLTEATTPREIAMASATGVFLAVLPLVGFHSVAIIFAATRLKLNRVIAFNVQHVCAPPLVPALAFEVGYYLFHGEWFYKLTFQAVFQEIHHRFYEYLAGAVILSLPMALAAGAGAYVLAEAYQRINRGLKR